MTASARRTAGITLAASLALHGCLALLAATAMTVLPPWPRSARIAGESVRVPRRFKAGDKFLLACRMDQSLESPAPQPGGMFVHLQGVWEIQAVTPSAAQPSRYTFTIAESEVITSQGTGALFKPGTVIAGRVSDAGAPEWTLDGAPADAAMTSLFRKALPLPAAQDADTLAAMFQPREPVSAGGAWPPDAASAAVRLAADGFAVSTPVTGSLTLSEPLEWGAEIPGRQLKGQLQFQASAVPGLPPGSALTSAAITAEVELFLPDDATLPVMREKWTTRGTFLCQLPGMASAGTVSAITTLERELGIILPPDESLPQEIEVTFVPETVLPSLNPSALKISKQDVPDKSEPERPPGGEAFIVPREDLPVIAPLDKDTPFISSRDMRAGASAAPLAGADARIPNQAGAELPGLSLFHAAAVLGSIKPQPQPAPPSEPVPETPPAPEPPQPKEERPPDPSATVKTENPDAPAPLITPALRERPPEPVPMTQAEQRPPSKSTPLRPREPVQTAKGLDNGPKPVVSSVKTKTKGGLSISGADSVDARDTPEGRYMAACHERIGLIWNSRLATVRGVAGTGSAEVAFDIDINGRVSNVRLVDPGKANPIFEDVCLTAVIKAKLPALPPSMKREIQDPLSGGRLRRTISFHRL